MFGYMNALQGQFPPPLQASDQADPARGQASGHVTEAHLSRRQLGIGFLSTRSKNGREGCWGGIRRASAVLGDGACMTDLQEHICPQKAAVTPMVLIRLHREEISLHQYL